MYFEQQFPPKTENPLVMNISQTEELPTTGIKTEATRSMPSPHSNLEGDLYVQPKITESQVFPPTQVQTTP